MNPHPKHFIVSVCAIAVGLTTAHPAPREVPLNQGWSFHRVDPGDDAVPDDGAASTGGFDTRGWESVSLPHTPRLDSPYLGEKFFKGVCWYRHVISADPGWRGKRVSAVFDGAMQKTDVWVNGKRTMTHLGGYLPFKVDLSDSLANGKDAVVALRLDNNASSEFPPGSDRIDFTYHGGLYRPARLVVTDPVHLTDAVGTDMPGGGGVFVCTTGLTGNSAGLLVRSHVANEGDAAADVEVEHTLLDPSGQPVARVSGGKRMLDPGGTCVFTSRLDVGNPKLWDPRHPYLYRLQSVVRRGGSECDRHEVRHGIRTVAATDEGFVLNGERVVLRGANRHMVFPWLGNAASDNMQYRDIRLLKDAGFNFVRLAHYPQSEATMAACDELGVMAIVCTPGWQFFGDNDSFRAHAQQNIREMVRWHRNHPSAVLWEVSLNETAGHDDFYAACAAIAREEFPGGALLTCGDSHGSSKTRHYDVTYTGWEGFYNRPLHKDARIAKGLHREYGDYEFGGQTSSTRVRRDASEESLLLQAWNFQWAHNRNLSWAHTIGDSIWAGIDTTSQFDRLDAQGRGLGSCWGPIDLDRLPKFSYYFFQSQRDPAMALSNCDSGPMVRIAGWWTPRSSPVKVVVFSNCDEVELLVNGKSVGRRKPDQGPDSDYGAYRPEADPMYWTKAKNSFDATEEAARNAKGEGKAMFDGGNCRHLDHPPFTFVPVNYEPGELMAVAYRGGGKVAQHVLKTPGKPAKLRLSAPTHGRPLAADGADALFVHAEVTDHAGEPVPGSSAAVRFRISGAGRLAGSSQTDAQAGIASTLVQASAVPGTISVTAESDGLAPATITLVSTP